MVPTVVSLPDVSTGTESLHESLCAGLGDGTQVVYEVGLGHADTGVLDRQGVVCLLNHNTRYDRWNKILYQ